MSAPYDKMSSPACVQETELDRQAHHLRRVAFCAVVVSTVAVVASVITLPLVYNYVQALQTHMMAEMEYCKV
jgi:hypothetical protein